MAGPGGPRAWPREAAGGPGWSKRRGGAGRGEAQRSPRDGERRRHGPLGVGERGRIGSAPGAAGEARLGPRGGGGERGDPGSAPGPGADPAAAAALALKPFGTRPLTQRERKPRGEPRPLGASWMPWLSFRAPAVYWVTCLSAWPAAVLYWSFCPSLETDALPLAGITYGCSWPRLGRRARSLSTSYWLPAVAVTGGAVLSPYR